MRVIPQIGRDPRLAEKVAELEQEVQRERDRRLEERFGWIFLLNILVDMVVFRGMEAWTAPLIIGGFQAVALVILAKRLGVNEVLPVLDLLAARLTGSKIEPSHPAASASRDTAPSDTSA